MIEVILWIVAFFVLWEGLFLYFYFIKVYEGSWFGLKFITGVFSGWIVLMHLVFIYDFETKIFSYHYLLYELGIIILLVVFFGLNKLIVDSLGKKNEQGKI